MHLNRTLFYVLLFIFGLGIVLLIIVDPSKVMSRIATGMVTGSFVGLLSTLVNYIHTKQTFFEDLYKSALDLHFDLQEELVKAEMKVEDIETYDKQYLIDTAQPVHKEDLIKKQTEEISYKQYYKRFNSSSYVPLFWGKNTEKVLEELEDFVSIKLKYISMFGSLKDSFVCLQDGHFSSKEEENLVIGNKDDFYEYIIKNIYDWRDYTCYCIRRLWKLMVALEKSLKPFSVGNGYKGMPIEMSQSTEHVYKDIPYRNPVKEKQQTYKNI